MKHEREFFIDNLLVRIHLIIVMIRWTGLAPWEFEFPFSTAQLDRDFSEIPQGSKERAQFEDLFLEDVARSIL